MGATITDFLTELRNAGVTRISLDFGSAVGVAEVATVGVPSVAAVPTPAGNAESSEPSESEEERTARLKRESEDIYGASGVYPKDVTELFADAARATEAHESELRNRAEQEREAAP